MWYKKKVELPQETIYEVISSEDDHGFGLAIADIIRSERHYHRITVESYTLISGKLVLHLDDQTVYMDRPGMSITIPTNCRHWARSLFVHESARVSVVTVPAWTKEDHILV